MTVSQYQKARTRYDNSLKRLPQLAGAWVSWMTRLYLLRHTPIVVYQMGGVGSVSIYAALQEANQLVFHSHHFTEEALAKGAKPRSWKWLNRHVIHPKRPAKFISLVRNPIDVKISAHFKNLDRPHMKRAEPYSVEEIIERFHRSVGKTDREFEWFNREIKAVLGIDVFAHPFPHEQGYQTYKNGAFELLVLRSELPDSRKGEIIAAFLGLPTLTIQRLNRADDRGHKETRRAFDQQLKIDAHRLNTWLESPFMVTFFSADEREAIRQRWIDSSPR